MKPTHALSQYNTTRQGSAALSKVCLHLMHILTNPLIAAAQVSRVTAAKDLDLHNSA